MSSMKAWSDSPIHPCFTTKFFVDTNILVYLVDNSYQSLTDFIELSKESEFIELVSSKYVIFEFVGVRKKEHYLRKVASVSPKSIKGEINFSSLLKYVKVFENPGVDFNSVMPNIKLDVEAEVEMIASDNKINFEYSTIHGAQLNPTFELCLSTKISNQDSLVFISAILPQPDEFSTGLQLLTNDKEFVKFYSEANIEHIFSTHNISKPDVIGIDKIIGKKNKSINLTEENSKENLASHLNENIIRLIMEKNKLLYLGTTFPPSNNNFPENIICFKFKANTIAPRGIYISILSKNLDFLYTSRKKIDALHHNNKELPIGFISSNTKINVSFRIVDIDINGDEIPVSMEIITALRSEGNFVFIHPDSKI